MKKITIPYFPAGMRYTTPLLFGLAIYTWTIGSPIWAGVLSLLGVIILTTRYVTVIDLVNKEYRDFLSFLWIPFEEERTRFKNLDKIVIRKDNRSQMLNSRSRSRQLDWASFTGTLIADDKNALDLLTRPNKKELIKGLKEFVAFLKVDIEDQTTSQHFKIDINRY